MGLLCFLGFHAWLEFADGKLLKRVCYCCPRNQTLVNGRWIDD
jgi:hypothetical protein